MEKAIAGASGGKRPKELPSIRTSWKTWRKENFHTMVLSGETGFKRDCSVDPNNEYYRSLGIRFPVGDVR